MREDSKLFLHFFKLKMVTSSNINNFISIQLDQHRSKVEKTLEINNINNWQ